MQARAISLVCYRDLKEFSQYMGFLLQKESETAYIKAHIVAGIKVLSYWDATAPDGKDDERIGWMHTLKQQVGRIIRAPRPDSQQLKEQGKCGCFQGQLRCKLQVAALQLCGQRVVCSIG